MLEVSKEKYAFFFQGVGIEYKEKINLLDDEQKCQLQYYSEVIQDEIGLDLWGYLYNSSVIKYDESFYDWVAIYVCDYIIYRTYLNNNIKPNIFLGYSMGLTTAMACGQAISFKDGLHLLLNSYKYDKCSNKEQLAMAVIVGMDFNYVENIIIKNNLKDYVDIAIENSEYCIVIAGNENCVKKVTAIAENEGAIKTKDLNVPYAFHTKHVKERILQYIQYTEEIDFHDSTIPILSSLNQCVIKDSISLKNELVNNLTSRIYWKSSIEKVVDMGINTFVEVSLSDSLTKASKLIKPDSKFITYKRFKNRREANVSNER